MKANKKHRLLGAIFALSLVSIITACSNNQKCECEPCPKDSEQQSQSESSSEQHGDGYDEGYVDGYVDGHSEGHDEGYEEGKEDGRQEGYEEGYNDGKEDQEGERVDYRTIHSNVQLEYLNNIDYSVLPNGINGSSENSKPLPLEFDVQESPLFNISEITNSTLRISEDRNFHNYVEVEGNNGHFEVYNQKINTKYYYYYFADTSHGTFFSEIKELFVKNEAPRLLNIDGVTNARDDGGWKIKGEDKYTKQGQLFRMGRLHTSGTKNITTDGIVAFKELGIKTEIDLRNSDDGNTTYQSAVDGVSYYNYQMYSDQSYFTNDANRTAIKQVLEAMGNANNYPIMFHCNIGTDRTGFISFIVNALLGVEERCLYQDYMMSNFGNIGGVRDTASIVNYISTLKNNYQGSNDLSVGAENYMLDLGVDAAKISVIKQVLLENN